MLCSVSLWTLTAISADRLLPLLLGLRYRQVVTLNRTHVIVINICAVPAVVSAMRHFHPVINIRHCMHDSYITVSRSLDLLLRKQYLSPPSSSKSSTRPCSTTEPNKSTEHSAIQTPILYCSELEKVNKQSRTMFFELNPVDMYDIKMKTSFKEGVLKRLS